MTIEQELADVKKRLIDAETDRDGAREQAQKNFKAFKEASDEAEKHRKEAAEHRAAAEKAQAEATKATGELASLQAKVDKFDETLAAEANKQIQIALAKHGHPALNLDPAADAPAAKPKKEFKDASGKPLRGLALAVAAHEHDYATKGGK